MVYEGEGKTFAFSDGATSAQGSKNFVKVTDAWTQVFENAGTLTSAASAIPV